MNGATGNMDDGADKFEWGGGHPALDLVACTTVNGNVELPFGHGRKYLNDNKLADYAVGGWSSSFVFRAQTGQPMALSDTQDDELDASDVGHDVGFNPKHKNEYHSAAFTKVTFRH